MNTQTTSVTLLAVTSTVGFFTAFLPDLSAVRKSTLSDKDVVNDVRMGEVAAAGLTVSVGLMASSMAKSPVPAIAGAIAAILLVVMYENVLRSKPKEGRR